MRVDDDISQLQALPQHILAQEKAITALTGQPVDQKWFVVYGSSAQQTLERLEGFIPALEQAKQRGWISGYRTIPLNSLARQQQDLKALKTAAPAIAQALASAGLTTVNPDLKPMPVTVDRWLSSPASEGWRLLWLTLPNGESGVLIPAEGVKESAALDALSKKQPGVAWLDRKHTFDELFALYRHILTGLLGIGINYTLFFSNPRGTPLTSLLAITLAMLTTLLTLGMLVFSATQAISSFGIVLVSGIFTAFLLSPLAMPTKREKK